MSATTRGAALSAVCLALLLAPGEVRAQGATPPTPPPQSASEAAAAKLISGGRPRDALLELDRAWTEYQRANDRLGMARVGLTRSAALAALGQIDEARTHAERSRQLGADHPLTLVTALSQLITMAVGRGDLGTAESYVKEALAAAARTGDGRTEIRLRQLQARVLDAGGRPAEAVARMREAIAIADKLGDDRLRIETRGAVSTFLLELSQYDEALAAAQEGHAIARTHPLARVRAGALYYLAQANNHVWNLDRAAALWPETLDAYREASDQRGLAVAMIQSVNTWFALGDFDRAATEGAQAVDLLGRVGLSAYTAEVSARVALSESRRGRLDEAARWSARARAALPTTHVARHLYVHNDLGLVAIDLGRFDEARSDFARVQQVAGDVGNVEYQWRAGWGFGRTAVAAGTPDDAVPHLERVIGVIERLRQTIPAASERAAFMTQRVAPYETLVEALLDARAPASADRASRALEVAERARSRALADLLAESRARITNPDLLAVRQQEVAFGGRFSTIQKRVIAATDDAARAAAIRDLEQAEHEYETLVSRVRRESPAYAALAYPQPLAAAELSAMLAADEVLVEFLVTPKRGFAWAVRRDRLESAAIPGQEQLEPQLRLLQAVLSSDDAPAVRRLGAHLYDQLLAPLASTVAGARRIIVVPDGVLQRLPFALLRSGDRWLIETHAVVTAPSATVLAHLRQRARVPAPRPLLAFAAPTVDAAATRSVLDVPTGGLGTLATAGAEVRDASRLMRARPEDTLIGAAAAERVLRSPDAQQYRVLHVAAHAVVDEMVPRRSAVLLTGGGDDDGLLQVNEIANLSLNADLVVLATCRSQVGRLIRGEGLLSLSRAFMHAGARSVMATLWDVPDRETSTLMRRFYERLAEGRPPDEALRTAQLAAIAAGGRSASPSAWAGFVLTGDTTSPILPEATGQPWPRAAGVGVVAVIMLVLAVAARRG